MVCFFDATLCDQQTLLSKSRASSRVKDEVRVRNIYNSLCWVKKQGVNRNNKNPNPTYFGFDSSILIWCFSGQFKKVLIRSPLYKFGHFEVSCFNRKTAPVCVSNECSAGSAGGWELVSIFQREKWKQFSDLGWACSNTGWLHRGNLHRSETRLDLDIAVINKK